MTYQCQIVFFCAFLLVATVLARPQVWNIGFNPPPPTRAVASSTDAPAEEASTTTAAPVQVTTPSREYYDCLARCPTTSEYNPVCGSDSQNYHNMARLNCAVRCGMSVTMVRAGACTG